jgi:hypothetical protein
MRVLLPSSVLTCLPSQLSVLPKSAPLHDVHHCKMPFKRIERRTLSMRSSAPSNDNNASSLMKNLWQHFGNTNPDALKIYALFDNQPVHNDHIAFRTLQNAHLGKEVIAQNFIDLGYAIKGEYHFADKHLDAIHLEQADQPRVFISELRLQDFNEEVQNILQPVAEKCANDPIVKTQQLLTSGCRWPIHQEHYLKLRAASEYAAWFYVFGHTPNHFTINVNKLKDFNSLADVNAFLKKHKVVLNTVGGEIKSAPGKLDQSSTVADKIDVTFSNERTVQVPFTFVEFAYRHSLKNGTLFNGFTEDNADKVFSSTDSGMVQNQ